MAAGTRQNLAGHPFGIHRLPADGESGREKAPRLFRAEHGISNQIAVLRDPENLIRRKLIPAVRAGDLGNKPQLPRDFFGWGVVHGGAGGCGRGGRGRALCAVVVSTCVLKALLVAYVCPAFCAGFLICPRLDNGHSPDLSPS